MPQKHKNTKSHKILNIKKITLVKFGALVLWWRKKIFIILPLFFLFLFISSYSQDDTLKLKQVNIYAKRLLPDAGLIRNDVDSIILTEKANLSLSELLSENTPVFIKSNGRGALATISFRGTAPSQTDVLWNGISIKSPMLGQVDFSLIPVHLIDELSLVHGPALIGDSHGAFGGSVLINNHPDWNNRFSVRAIQGFGSYSTFNEFIQINAGNYYFQSKTRLFYTYSKNNFKFINKNIADIDAETGEYIYPVQRNENADYSQYGLLQELYARPDTHSIASLKLWLQHDYRSIPRLNTYEGNDYANINRQNIRNYNLVYDWNRYFKKFNYLLHTGLTHQDMIYYLNNFISGYGYFNAVYSESAVNGFFNNVKMSWNPMKILVFDSKLSIDYHSVSTLDTVTGLGYIADRLENSAFLACYGKIGNRLTTSIAIRQNYVDNKFLPLISSCGFDFIINDTWSWMLKGDISRNYRLPSLNDLYWLPGGNPDLHPEKGITAELSMSAKKTFNHIKAENTFTAYLSDINGWILWIPSPKGYWQPYNISRVITKGAEYFIHLEATIKKFVININGTYAYTLALNYGEPEIIGQEAYGKQLPYVPVHSGNIMVNISRNGYFISYMHNSYSERYTTSTNDISRQDWLYPYFMNNISTGKDFKLKKFSLSIQLKIYNIFNEKYRSVLGRSMPEINYACLVMLKF